MRTSRKPGSVRVRRPTPASSTDCRVQRGWPESPTRSRRMDGAVARSRTTCETGSSRASVTGVRPYPSSTVRSAAPSRFRKMNCPFSCPKMPTSNRQDSHLSHSTPISSPRPARSAERKRGGRRTRWTRSWTRRGITCATRALHSTAGRSTPTV